MSFRFIYLLGASQLLMVVVGWFTVSMQVKLYLPNDFEGYNLALFVRDYFYYMIMFALSWIALAVKYQYSDSPEILNRIKWGGVAFLVATLLLVVGGVISAQSLIEETYHVWL